MGPPSPNHVPICPKTVPKLATQHYPQRHSLGTLTWSLAWNHGPFFYEPIYPLGRLSRIRESSSIWLILSMETEFNRLDNRYFEEFDRSART